MRFQRAKFFTITSLLVMSPVVWAHPAIFEGDPLANLLHLLTEPDHLLILAGIGLVAGICQLHEFSEI